MGDYIVTTAMRAAEYLTERPQVLEYIIAKTQFVAIAVIGVIVFIGLVRFSNWTLGVNFTRDVLPGLKQDPNAMAAYFGDRLKAMALLVGLAMIAGVIAP